MSVGLHLDMGEWIFQEGQWRPRYQVVDANDPPGTVASHLLGRGDLPGHLMSFLARNAAADVPAPA